MPGDGSQQMAYTLQTQGRINEVEDFKNIIIRTAEQGGLVYLKDIATVEIGEENYRASSKFNGAPSVAIAINQLAGANALDAMDGVKKEIERLSQRFPEDITYTIGYDSTKYILASIEEVIFTLLLTFALVILVCYVFAGLAVNFSANPDYSSIPFCHFCSHAGSGLQPKYDDSLWVSVGNRSGG